MASHTARYRQLRPLHIALSLAVLACLIVNMPEAARSAQPEPAQDDPRTSRPVDASPGSTLAQVRERGVLRWGADAADGAPFTFYDPSDPSIIGFEYDIMGQARNRR